MSGPVITHSEVREETATTVRKNPHVLHIACHCSPDVGLCGEPRGDKPIRNLRWRYGSCPLCREIAPFCPRCGGEFA